MTDTVAGIVVLARQAADLLPALPQGGTEHDPRVHAWESLVCATAGALAQRAEYDVDVLRRALWPPVDARNEPAWRVLLTLALLVSERRVVPDRVRGRRPTSANPVPRAALR